VIRPVTLHHRIDGAGPGLVLLHGGGGTTDDLAALRDRLVPAHRVISADQRGHGRTPFEEPLTYAAMAGDTGSLLEDLGAGPSDLVGWSDGAIVALLVARDRPDLVRRVVAIGANVDSVPPEPGHLSPESIVQMTGLTADDLGLPPGVGEPLLAMWQGPPGITFDDLGRIDAPLLFLAADRDLVTLDHTVGMFRAAAHGQLAIVPGADHSLPQTHADLVAALIERFLAAE